MKDCETCQFSYDEKIETICPSCGSIFKGILWDDIPTIIKFLIDLSNRSAQCIDVLKSKGIPSDDTLRVKLAAFNVITLRVIFTLKDYEKDIQFNDSRIPKAIRTNNSHLEESKIQQIMEIIDVYNETSYMTMSLFHFEDFFFALAKKLGFNQQNKYGKIATYLIDNSKIDEKKENKDMLILPSLMRNCFHSSFHYRGKNRNVYVKNILFKFENNVEPSFLSWRYIIFSFNNILEVIEKLINE